MSRAFDVRQVETGPTFETWQGNGTLRLNWNRRGGLRIVVSGHGSGDFAPIIVEKLDRVVTDDGRVSIALDFWDMPTYDSKLRLDLVEWGLRSREAIDKVHLISKSKVVTMGATIANIALNNLLTLHQQRASFDAFLQKDGLTR